MFDSSRPPFLVLPITMLQSTYFPSHEGYVAHFLPNGEALICYKDGWTLPLSVQQKKLVTTKPLLLVHDSGRVTSAGSTFIKGFAHQFCAFDGTSPNVTPRSDLFDDKPGEEWMLTEDGVVVIWLQYGYKNQFIGASGNEMELHHYGKLLIIRLDIREDLAPRLDKNADAAGLRAIQYRVEESRLLCEEWDLINADPEYYLMNVLTAHQLERFQGMVRTAIGMASTV